MNKLLQMLDGKPYIETLDEVKNEPGEVRKAGMSDYCLANGGCVSWSDATTPYGKPTCWHSLASCRADYKVDCVYHGGDYGHINSKYRDAGVVPALRLNLPSKDITNSLSAKELFGCEFSVGTVVYKCNNDGKTQTYYTITFPSTRVVTRKVDKALAAKLQDAMNKGTLEKTKQGYTGRMNQDKTFKKFDTYQYNGKEYVYVQAKMYDSGKKTYQDGSPVVDGEWIFLEIGPATLRIKNDWKNLPKCINPKGNGKDEKLYLRMLDAVNAGVPFSQEGSVDYDGGECDLRRYVEEEFVHDLFLDDEQEKQTNNFDLSAKLKEITSSEEGLHCVIEALNEIAPKYFVKDSESMKEIAEVITGYISDISDKLYENSEFPEEVQSVEDTLAEEMENYKKIITAKREEQAKVAAEEKALSDAKAASSAKTKAAISDLGKFKHQKFPQGERVHKDRHSFNNDDELV